MFIYIWFLFVIYMFVSGKIFDLFYYLEDYKGFEVFSNLIYKKEKIQPPKLSKDEFKDLYVGYIAVHCPTRKSAETFLKLADSFGYEWICGDSFASKTMWKEHREDTVYYVCQGQYGSVSYAKSNGYKIVEFIV